MNPFWFCFMLYVLAVSLRLTAVKDNSLPLWTWPGLAMTLIVAGGLVGFALFFVISIIVTTIGQLI